MPSSDELGIRIGGGAGMGLEFSGGGKARIRLVVILGVTRAPAEVPALWNSPLLPMEGLRCA